jgi:hypothetical protein
MEKNAIRTRRIPPLYEPDLDYIDRWSLCGVTIMLRPIPAALEGR